MKKTAAPKAKSKAAKTRQPAKARSAAKARKPAKAPKMATAAKAASAKSPSALIDQRIADLGDWRGELLSRVRKLIQAVVPGVTEEWKWRGVPVWYQDGMLLTGETYKEVVKFTFAKGAALSDPARLFNSSLEGNTRRAIDFRAGEKVNEKALKALVRDAVTLNRIKR